MKINRTNTLPSESGFYFVKTKSANYWQCLVRLNGTAPFLTVGYNKTLFKTTDDEILRDLTNLDWSEVMVLDNANQDHVDVLDKTQLEAIRMMKDPNMGKLHAVKWIKEQFDWGLKDAKEYCDALQEKYIKPNNEL